MRSVGTTGDWVGLANHRKLLAGTSFWHSATLSLAWVLANAVLQTALALVTALTLHQRFPGVRIARTWVILTWIVPTVVVVMIWRWLFSTSGGIVNPLLMQAGVTDRPVGDGVRDAGLHQLLALVPFHRADAAGGLTRIPEELHEAARIEGAGAWKRFTRITWPLLAPTLGVLLVIGTLLSFDVFDIIWLMTAGGPAGGTQTLPVLIYETAFKSYRMNEAAAVAVLTTVFLVGFAIVATRWLARSGDDR